LNGVVQEIDQKVEALEGYVYMGDVFFYPMDVFAFNQSCVLLQQ